MKFIVSFIIIINFTFNLEFANSNLCIDEICIPTEYNKLTKPPPINETTEVLVKFKRIQIFNIDENKSTITIKLAILMFWFEPRIFISPSNSTEEHKRLPKEFVNLIWLPDAYIPHVHKINKYNFIHNFEVYFYAMDELSRTLLGCQIEVEVVLFCKMTFEAYPIDENTCYFTLGSYAPLNQSAQIYNLWETWESSGPVVFDASEQVAQLGFAIDIKEGLPKNVERPWNGSFQRTGFEVRFQRKVTRFIPSYYIPSGILVVLSWVSNLIYHYSEIGSLC